jgi:hypothetical protein
MPDLMISSIVDSLNEVGAGSSVTGMAPLGGLVEVALGGFVFRPVAPPLALA